MATSESQSELKWKTFVKNLLLNWTTHETYHSGFNSEQKKISYPDQFNEISAMSFEDVVLEIVDADVVAKRTRQLWNIKV